MLVRNHVKNRQNIQFIPQNKQSKHRGKAVKLSLANKRGIIPSKDFSALMAYIDTP
jgi:hypothetical protein